MKARRTRLSVIMPVHDGERYLGAAIRSVLDQTCGDFEMIAVDDGSTDRSREILAGYPEITVLHQANAGQSAARNAGIARASSDLIALIDQDDRWHPDKIARQLAIMESHPEIGLLYSDVDTIDDRGRTLESRIIAAKKLRHPKRSLTDCLSEDMFIIPSSVMLRRRVFQQAGGFDPALSGYEDDDLFLRMFSLTRFEFCPDALAQWRMHSASSSHSPRMDKSRVIYFAKLLKGIAADPAGRLHYRDEVIVPRFLRIYLIQFYLARKQGAWERCETLRRDLFGNLGPYLRRLPRLMTWLVTRRARWSGWLITLGWYMPKGLVRLAGIR